MQKLIAIWNIVRGAWEIPESKSLLCEHSELYLETWPTSGTMRNGRAYEPPTPELPTIDTEYLSSPGPLLRTPTASEVEGGPVHPDIAKAKGQTLRLTSQVLHLLATPTTMDNLPARVGDAYEKARNYGGRKNRIATGNLREQVVHLLPTPITTDWGGFSPAIERWERVTARSAPEPTLPDGQRGQHRLSSKFTEWLMGLPDGWITGHGLHRKDEIKMAGNGVVPQQAKLALRVLLDRLS